MHIHVNKDTIWDEYGGAYAYKSQLSLVTVGFTSNLVFQRDTRVNKNTMRDEHGDLYMHEDQKHAEKKYEEWCG